MKNRKTYSENKARIIELAIDWQYEFAQNSHFWSEYAYWTEYFTKQAKRYGLLKEFRENGII